MPRIKPKLRATKARTERPCPSCRALIRFGDYIREREMPDGTVRWCHIDCRGRA